MNPGRLDNRCTVLQETEQRDEFGDVTRTWSEVGTEWIGMRPMSSGLTDFGPGEQPESVVEGTARGNARIALQNVLRVDGGPYAGTNWRVVAVFPAGMRPMGLRLQRYNRAVS